jgi:DNA-binding IclR family transcriptional regulator
LVAATGIRARLGWTQARLLDAVTTAGYTGMTAVEAAAQGGMAATNAPPALKALAERGLVEAFEDTPKSGV